MKQVRWNAVFENLIEKVLKTQKEIYLLGDFNKDLLNDQIGKPWLEYMYVEQFGFFQKVNQPTRSTHNSQTLIDHIYCNIQDNVSSIDIPRIGLSDHFPVFLTRKTNCSLPKWSHHTIKYRSYKNFDETSFLSDLQSVPWDIIKVFDDTNEVVETWSSMFLNIVDKHPPMKTHRVKHSQQPKWITPEIIDCIKTRDKYKAQKKRKINTKYGAIRL